ncbi:hypothetical protein [Micromonospora sp. LOL_015]|uniref:hypothetical protein n=1 Tax=Micromonospora sp. LOL_015 TaxID=3345416 RepID=UPI003A8B25DC
MTPTPLGDARRNLAEMPPWAKSVPDSEADQLIAELGALLGTKERWQRSIR